MSFIFAEPTQLWLDIPPAVQAHAWRQSQTVRTAGRRWSVYLNQLCLRTFLPWLQESYAEAMAIPPPNAPASCWELVEGTAFATSAATFVVLPYETIGHSEFQVPQEWVDIPNWAADYYLAATIDVEQKWLEIWGYTTHRHLKSVGQYDATTRSYCLDEHDVIRDMSVLSVARQFCPQEQTRADVPALTSLSEIQVENLVQRLSNPAIAFPRLEVPFSIWGALLNQEDWRQRLYHQRQDPSAVQTLSVHLSQWFDHAIEVGWKTFEELFPDSREYAFSLRKRQSEQDLGIEQRVKLIPLDRFSDRLVILLVKLKALDDSRSTIHIQLHPQPGMAVLPSGLQLALIAQPNDEVLQSIQARGEDDYIQIQRFTCASGFQFRVEITLDDVTIIENFMA